MNAAQTALLIVVMLTLSSGCAASRLARTTLTAPDERGTSARAEDARECRTAADQAAPKPTGAPMRSGGYAIPGGSGPFALAGVAFALGEFAVATWWNQHHAHDTWEVYEAKLDAWKTTWRAAYDECLVARGWQ